jgi:hypothetical protein
MKDDDMLKLAYILDGQIPVPCDDVATWADWMAKNDCQVANTTLAGQRISTVFLGLNHQPQPSGLPLLFETMIFDENGVACEMWRCSTWAEAESMHQVFVDLVGSRQVCVETPDEKRTLPQERPDIMENWMRWKT